MHSIMAIFLCSLFCTFAVFVVAIDAQQQIEYAPIVQLTGGQVRGVVQQTEDGQKVHQYMGIRYGRAERFAKPKPVEPWTGVYDASSWRAACPQTNFDKPPFGVKAQTTIMSEDCLFLNVWRPAAAEAEAKGSNRSVMFWMHGGSFEHGTIFSLLYDGRYLAAKGDVLVVTVNFRLGTFGLLYGGTPEFPGNLLVYDQILALKWVRENIHQFGGDPNKITVFGESSGAFSISAFILSPLTKGLFRRAILQSGAPTNTATNEQLKPLNRTLIMGKLNHCPETENVVEVVHCLRNRTMTELLEAQKVAVLVGQLASPIFEDEVLPVVSAVEALKKGLYNRDIDLMYGVTRDEATIFVESLFTELESNETVLTLNSTRDYIHKIYAGSPESVRNEIADFYTRNLHNPTQNELRLLISQSTGDPGLVCSTILFGEHVAKMAPKNHYYAYQLAQPVKAVPFPILGGCHHEDVCHGMDVIYLFGTQLLTSKADEYQLSKDMIRAWTNFAKTGEPGKLGSVEWTEAFNSENPHTRLMSLNVKDYRMVSNYYREVCNVFWEPKLFS